VRLSVEYAAQIQEDLRLQGLLSSPADAKVTLLRELRSGRISTPGISRIEWLKLELFEDARGRFVPMRSGESDDRWVDVTIRREHVLRLWPVITEAMKAAQPVVLPAPIPLGFDPVPLLPPDDSDEYKRVMAIAATTKAIAPEGPGR
jgi:hypothetical protein